MIDPAPLVGAGAALGAVLRFATGRYVGGVAGNRRFPYGTFTVNVLGSFVLALVTFLGAGEDVLLFVGTGACGSYTTFSSFSVDTVRLWETGDRRLAVWYAAANLFGALVGIGIAALLV
ncbi:fluoride efflux transporter CrcB [Haloplanus salinus]|jgi:CrcB protein|uniref:Fluoride-specific ion channel FluC n=1 Tax=Haloplanus salinus TaxID=1126245 RepID=A0A368N8C0_9EURY|nr:fluoride efflux transporter CrcB [Haloplanus salinus]RCU46283.1 fluoride efflux transporter CrcB [Haloplanus salinus]